MARHDGTTALTATTPASVLGTPTASPNTATVYNDDVLPDIFRLFNDPYSPSKPQLVYDGDWVNLQNLADYPDGKHHSDVSTAKNSSVPQDVQAYGHVGTNVVAHQGIAQATANVAAVASSATSSDAITDAAQDDSQAVINFLTPEWIAFFQSSAFSDWCAYGMPVDVSLFFSISSATCSDLYAFTFAAFPERVIYRHGTKSPGAGGAVGTIFVIPFECLYTEHLEEISRRPMAVDSTDINDIKFLNSAIEHADDDSGSDSSSEEVRPRLTATGVKGHYWHKGNIKYWSHVLHDRRANGHSVFGGTKAASWKSWDDKEPGTIFEFRIMEYFRINGHEGPLREMLYHLLPRPLFRILMECKVNGTLNRFFFGISTIHPYLATLQHTPFSTSTAWALSSSWEGDV
ncbi:hypothetical protein QFC20_003884 [Naganishia adeliensis]|uniref:Uncharacterized protein n=1 Tax=Naganishia adeliensis TaxID=92952 RepID=A0ACC2W736_9TREE|nr:hypothetical protein QFC20_003884 [Naganishia adeliensis]